MCGIAGIARREGGGIDTRTLARMAAAIQHRGPDGYGFYAGQHVGLAHTRLSIIDLAGGSQPLSNEDGRVWVTYNGEVYNYRELAAELTARGHRVRTRCDTEVLVHGWEEWGPGLLDRLNGQFAFAIHDQRTQTVFLARDRFGVRPLFYALRNDSLYFASEVKAIFATGEVPAAADPAGLDEVFTFWATRAPRTPFRGVYSLEPGTCARWKAGYFGVERYYSPRYQETGAESPSAVAELGELMRSSVAFRMRADVPVGGYLSGGLDSTITCALAAKATPHALRTFSVSFQDPRLDESGYQQLVAQSVGSEHAVQRIGSDEIAEAFPAVIRHTETPLVRTGPAPLFLLSRLTRERGIKVVLTGEGADELFMGYDLFKETRLRHMHLRHPGSPRSDALFGQLYPYLEQGGRGGEFWRRFFSDAGSPSDPLFSHLPRFLLTSRIKEFYSADMRAALTGHDPLAELRDSLPPEFQRWSPLHKAAYLEVVTLLAPYLLSSQGDRMAMAHGVEGRFPFLDHRLFEFAAALPTRSKLRGLREKDILRRWARSVIPARVEQRSKQPYRAPDAPAFFGPRPPAYVEALLDSTSLRDTGLFDPRAVAGLVRRCREGRASGFRENQALVAILSTQLSHTELLTSRAPLPTLGRPDVSIDQRVLLATPGR